MNKIERWLKIIENHYDLVLNGYEKLIIDEKIHLIMKRDCNSKKHFLEIQYFSYQWKKQTLKSIKKIDSYNFCGRYVSMIKETLNEELNVTENIEMINSFEKKINENFIPKIHELQNDINIAVNDIRKIYQNKKFHLFRLFQNIELKVWISLSESLKRQEDLLTHTANEFVGILKK